MIVVRIKNSGKINAVKKIAVALQSDRFVIRFSASMPLLKLFIALYIIFAEPLWRGNNGELH